MLELKARLSGGQLADWTSALRDYKPANWDGNVTALPDAEFAIVAAKAARKAKWFDDGQAPTDEQLHAMSLDELLDLGEGIAKLWQQWNTRRAVTDEEKNA